MENELQALIEPQNISRIVALIQKIDGLEALLFAGIIIASLCLGTLLNRVIARHQKNNWGMRFFNFLAPLLSSLIAILLVICALSIYDHYEITPTILPLGIKLVIAWFAIRAVMLMSSRRTAGWFIALVIVPVTLLQMFGIWEPLKKVLKSWEISIGNVDISAFAILKSIAAIAVLFWLVGFFTNMVEGRLTRMRGLRASNRALIMKIFQIVLYLIVFLIVLQVLGVSLTALSVFGGALGVGIGFGLQKIASNFISGIILLFEKSIEVDDMIELENGTTGFVRHTGARYTLLETAEGKEVLIPNEDFITQRMVNWTYSNKKARTEIRVSIGYECDLNKALQIMREAAVNHPRCIKDPAPFCVVDSFGDSGIGLILQFWVGDVTDGRMTPKSDVMLTIWNQFREHNITIPYPQQEIRIIREAGSPPVTPDILEKVLTS